MKATWRALPGWLHPERPRLYGTRMRASWQETLDLLELEIEAAAGDDVLVGVVVPAASIGLSGNLKAGGRTNFLYRGVEVSFDVPGGARRLFYTDAYDDVGQNLRAIGLGLKALRAVDRYGITSAGEQYAGFAALPSGDRIERGQELVAQHGGIAKALLATHPDHGGKRADFDAVQAYRERVGDRA